MRRGDRHHERSLERWIRSTEDLLGSPILYEEIEDKLTSLLGSEDSLLLPTITHIHMSAIPVLAVAGTVCLDSRAQQTIYDGCALAQARGANVVRRFAHEDLNHLEALLRDSSWRRPWVICIDGVNSMTGNARDLAGFAALAREHDVILYVDDAHGFGVIGERSEAEPCNYGVRGNGDRPSRRRKLREHRPGRRPLQGVLLAARVHRLPDRAQAGAQTAAPPYLDSGPSPVASLATVLSRRVRSLDDAEASGSLAGARAVGAEA